MSLSTNLISYWKLDESSGNAVDSVSGYTLTNNNTTSYVAGKINNGVNIQASGSKYFSRTNQYDFTAGSIQVWVNVTTFNTGAVRPAIVSTRNGATSKGFELRFNRGDINNKLDFFFGDNLFTCQSTTALVAGAWYHVVVTWTTAGKKIYVNGVLETNNANAETLAAGTTFKLGNGLDSEIQTAMILDEVGIWDRALTAGEVSQLWSGGNGIQYSFANVDSILAFDNATNQGDTTASSLTFSHTVNSNTNGILFVGTEGSNGGSDVITGVTYATVPMTKIGSSYKGGGGRWIGLYYLLAPASGANNVVVSASGSDVIGATAAGYTGAKQTGQPDASATATTASGTMTGTVTVVATNSWLMMFCHGANPTTGADCVVRASGSGYGILDSNAARNAGSQSITGAQTGAQSGLVASFSPAVSGPANVKTVNGLAIASVKTVNGLAIGSVKTINGLV